MKKILTVLGIYFVSGIALSLTILLVAENYVDKLNQSSSIQSSKNDTGSTQNLLSLSDRVILPDEQYSVQFSYDNKYYTYLKDSKIYICNIKNGEVIHEIEDSGSDGIIFYELLYDKNVIVYFTESKGKTSSTLNLKTYNIDSEKEVKYNKFTVYNFSKIKQMHMSPIINILYINVEVKSGMATTNTIYSIDLFNSMGAVRSGVQIDSFLMLQLTNNVYYKYSNSNIYYGYTKLNFFNEKVEMIGIDKDDNVYFIGLESKNKVYKVNKTRLVKTIELTDTDVVKTYSNNQEVYVVYPTYVLCVSSQNPYFRVGRLTKYVEFVAVKGNMMYLKTSNNVLTMTELIKE